MKKKHAWTTEERYRPYEQWPANYLSELKKTVDASSWRFTYHIQPPTGLLNDPNGFSYFNGKWQLFYQAYPMGPVHGIKSWHHVTSTNLVDWEDQGLSLLPDCQWDSHGVYSGSALPVENQLFLVYTGNVRDENWERHAYQLGAWMDQNNHITKLDQPLLAEPPVGYTHEFRDPQLFHYQDHYLMLIGAQDQQKKGKILTYRSSDLKTWELVGELQYTSEDMGFMIECPNLIFSDDQPILLFCPQGVPTDVLDYQNIYPNAYVLGQSYDAAANQLCEPTEPKNLDEGFDVYATQAFNASDGRTLAVSWIGLPELAYPTDQEGWAHCLSIIKELKVKDGQLFQQPVAEMKELRSGTPELLGPQRSEVTTVNQRYELSITFDTLTAGSITLFGDTQKKHGLQLTFDPHLGKMKLDRSHTNQLFGEEFGLTREFTISNQPLTLKIFVDASVVEIFINHGEQTATARYFPEPNETQLSIKADGDWNGELWQLRSMNKLKDGRQWQ